MLKAQDIEPQLPARRCLRYFLCKKGNSAEMAWYVVQVIKLHGDFFGCSRIVFDSPTHNAT